MKSTMTAQEHLEAHSIKRTYVSGEKPEGTIPMENMDFKYWKERRKHIVNDLSKPCEFR